MDLSNCPECGEIYIKSKFREVCEKCWREEEAAYDTVYKFMRKRENRAATMLQVVESTGVSEVLILKFIKNGKLQITQFPNLGYPCDKCGKIIRTGKLCEGCASEILEDLKNHEREEEFKQKMNSHKATYFTRNK
ncbi:TIGR03826 family flagellar region protein [Heyndrickxia sp. MSNUG]|uniref:TIGR03826 family flagellar region protein n=1 Tax=Heyndrickxia sp. MSNUG TaxID=3136677 RepID=UPI003C2C2084